MQNTSDALQIVADLHDDHVGALFFTQGLVLTADELGLTRPGVPSLQLMKRSRTLLIHTNHTRYLVSI